MLSFRVIARDFFEFYRVTFTAVLKFPPLRPAVAFVRMALLWLWQMSEPWRPTLVTSGKKVLRFSERRLRSLVLFMVNYRIGRMALQSVDYVLAWMEHLVNPQSNQGSTSTETQSTSDGIPKLLHYKPLSTQLSIANTPPAGRVSEEAADHTSPGSEADEVFHTNCVSLLEDLSDSINEDYMRAHREQLVKKIRDLRSTINYLSSDFSRCSQSQSTPLLSIQSKSSKTKAMRGEASGASASPSKRKRMRTDEEDAGNVPEEETRESENGESSFEDWPSYGDSTKDESSKMQNEVTSEAETPNVAEVSFPDCNENENWNGNDLEDVSVSSPYESVDVSQSTTGNGDLAEDCAVSQAGNEDDASFPTSQENGYISEEAETKDL